MWTVNVRIADSKLYISPKYSKHWPYTVASTIDWPYAVVSTIDCGCNKILNHGLDYGVFFSFTSQAYTLPHTLNVMCVSLFKFHIWILKQFSWCPK